MVGSSGSTLCELLTVRCVTCAASFTGPEWRCHEWERGHMNRNDSGGMLHRSFSYHPPSRWRSLARKVTAWLTARDIKEQTKSVSDAADRMSALVCEMRERADRLSPPPPDDAMVKMRVETQPKAEAGVEDLSSDTSIDYAHRRVARLKGLSANCALGWVPMIIVREVRQGRGLETSSR